MPTSQGCQPRSVMLKTKADHTRSALHGSTESSPEKEKTSSSTSELEVLARPDPSLVPHNIPDNASDDTAQYGPSGSGRKAPDLPTAKGPYRRVHNGTVLYRTRNGKCVHFPHCQFLKSSNPNNARVHLCTQCNITCIHSRRSYWIDAASQIHMSSDCSDFIHDPIAGRPHEALWGCDRCLKG